MWPGLPAAAAEYLVLTVPAGTHTITERLTISRSWLVLRGASSAQTTLYFPKRAPRPLQAPADLLLLQAAALLAVRAAADAPSRLPLLTLVVRSARGRGAEP